MDQIGARAVGLQPHAAYTGAMSLRVRPTAARRMLVVAFAFALSALVGCGSSDATPGVDAGGGGDAGTPGDGGAFDAGMTVTGMPRVHRAAPVGCPTERGAGTATPIAGEECSMDSDCTAGTNGRCLVSTGGARRNSCSYDQCSMDSACMGQVCDCRPSATSSAPNRCLGGDCVVDADCGAGGYCSPSVGFDSVNYPYVGYYCHTAADTCLDDEDCAAMGATARCAYDPTTSRWACSNELFLPP